MDREQQVRRLWDSLARGDLSVMQAALCPHARWRAVQDGPWNCEDRAAIIEVMGRNLKQGLAGRIEEVIEVGERTVVAFRPESHGPDAWPLEDGIRHLVLTYEGELISEMKGCLHRASALEYASSGG